jgi:hypothetical protein
MITHPTNHSAMDQIAVYLIFSDFLLFPLIYWFLFMYSWLDVLVTSLNRSEASSDLIPDHPGKHWRGHILAYLYQNYMHLHRRPIVHT